MHRPLEDGQQLAMTAQMPHHPDALQTERHPSAIASVHMRRQGPQACPHPNNHVQDLQGLPPGEGQTGLRTCWQTYY
eukprot:scaffold126634_cov24-Tisochrysis_lutea.AAC.1